MGMPSEITLALTWVFLGEFSLFRALGIMGGSACLFVILTGCLFSVTKRERQTKS